MVFDDVAPEGSDPLDTAKWAPPALVGRPPRHSMPNRTNETSFGNFRLSATPPPGSDPLGTAKMGLPPWWPKVLVRRAEPPPSVAVIVVANELAHDPNT